MVKADAQMQRYMAGCVLPDTLVLAVFYDKQDFIYISELLRNFDHVSDSLYTDPSTRFYGCFQSDGTFTSSSNKDIEMGFKVTESLPVHLTKIPYSGSSHSQSFSLRTKVLFSSPHLRSSLPSVCY